MRSEVKAVLNVAVDEESFRRIEDGKEVKVGD